MIGITVNRADFEYDLYGLIQAFFPHDEIQISYDVPEEERGSLPYQTRDKRPGEVDRELKVTYLPGKARISFVEKAACGRTGSKEIVYPSSWPIDPAHDPDTRKEMKDLLKREVYRILHEVTGKTLPWGTLTGIRPTKIPLTLLDGGKSESDIRSIMKREYLTSDEKIFVALTIAKSDHDLFSRLDTARGWSLYIGIPFCPSTCLYCSFPSYARAGKEGLVGPYLKALEKEIRASKDLMGERTLHTVYIGGGTPTALSASELDCLLTFLDETLSMGGLLEYTVEAGRPDSITGEKLSVMRDHRVSRISVNPQTMHDKTLRLIGRAHTVEDFRRAYCLSREAGFDNINTDLILGLPGETKEDMEYTLKEVAALRPDDLTVHSLAIKSRSRLREEWAAYRDYAMENSDQLMGMAYRAAEGAGLRPYYLYRQKNMVGNLENVGFSAPGKIGLYNVLMMEERETVLACGAGTDSKYISPEGKKTGRSEDVRDIPSYIERIDEMIGRKKKELERSN